jgi:hypothetical protein
MVCVKIYVYRIRIRILKKNVDPNPNKNKNNSDPQHWLLCTNLRKYLLDKFFKEQLHWKISWMVI